MIVQAVVVVVVLFSLFLPTIPSFFHARWFFVCVVFESSALTCVFMFAHLLACVVDATYCMLYSITCVCACVCVMCDGDVDDWQWWLIVVVGGHGNVRLQRDD